MISPGRASHMYSLIQYSSTTEIQPAGSTTLEMRGPLYTGMSWILVNTLIQVLVPSWVYHRHSWSVGLFGCWTLDWEVVGSNIYTCRIFHWIKKYTLGSEELDPSNGDDKTLIRIAVMLTCHSHTSVHELLLSIYIRPFRTTWYVYLNISKKRKWIT